MPGRPFPQEDGPVVGADLVGFAAPKRDVEASDTDLSTLFRRAAAPAVNEPPEDDPPKDKLASPNEGGTPRRARKHSQDPAAKAP